MKKSCPVITPDIVALSNDIRVPRGSLSMRISGRKDGKKDISAANVDAEIKLTLERCIPSSFRSHAMRVCQTLFERLWHIICIIGIKILSPY